MPPEVLAQYQKGAEVTEAAFTSTSKNPAGANSLWPEVSNVEMQIISKTGKDVSGLSKSPEEMEVLFRSGTPFTVTERFVDPVTGRTVIRMVEK
nr:ADP-ribosyltransferase [Nocardia fusca]